MWTRPSRARAESGATPAPPGPTSTWRSARSAIRFYTGSTSSWTRRPGRALPAKIQAPDHDDLVARARKPRRRDSRRFCLVSEANPCRRGLRHDAVDKLRRSKSGRTRSPPLVGPGRSSAAGRVRRLRKEHADTAEVVERFTNLRECSAASARPATSWPRVRPRARRAGGRGDRRPHRPADGARGGG